MRCIVQESVSREGNGFFLDRKDASITRTDAQFRTLFGRAGLKLVQCELQPGLPRAVFAVNMYVLCAHA